MIGRSPRIGLGVSVNAVRAVILDRGRVTARSEMKVSGERSIEDAVAAALDTLPHPRWGRPFVVAAIGPSSAQVRRLRALPAAAPRVLNDLVRENASRFFTCDGRAVITVVDEAQDDSAWAAAFDAGLVQSIALECQRKGYRLRFVVPTVTVLAAAVESPQLSWRDGGTIADSTYDSTNRLAELHLAVADGGSDTDDGIASDCCLIAALSALGPGSRRFADAFGAATTSDDRPMLALAGSAVSNSAGPLVRRLAIASGAFATCATLAAVAPALVAHRREQSARREIAELGPRRIAAADSSRALANVTRTLAVVSAFDRGRRSSTLDILRITEALPDSAFLLSLQFERGGVALTALSPRTADLMSRAAGVPGAEPPTIVGAVTPEEVAGKRLERAVIRFQWRRTDSARVTRAVGAR